MNERHLRRSSDDAWPTRPSAGFLTPIARVCAAGGLRRGGEVLLPPEQPERRQRKVSVPRVFMGSQDPL